MELPNEVLLWLGHPMDKRATIPQNPIEALKEALAALTIAKYLMVAVFTFLIYDMALTYRREVQLIWGSRWTFVRVLFTLTRYFIPCVLILNICFSFHPRLTAKVCKVETRVMAATGIFSNAVMMCILLLRVWAIWGRKLWMLGVLLAVFASSQLPPAILIGGELSKLQFIDNPLPGVLTGCVATSQSGLNTNWVHLFVSSLTYESTLFALTLLQAWIINKRGVGTPILTLLTRDGAWYFLVVIGSVSLTAIGTSIPKTQVAALLSQFFMAMMACTCSRLLLRLRGFYTPTDQSTDREGLQSNDISMLPYSSRRHGSRPRPVALESHSEVVVYVTTTTHKASKLDV